MEEKSMESSDLGLLLAEFRKKFDLLQTKVLENNLSISGYTFYVEMCNLYDKLKKICECQGTFFHDMAVGSTMGDELWIIKEYSIYEKGCSEDKLRKLMQTELNRMKRDFSDVFNKIKI